MIGISVLKPRTGLMPRSYRRINTALGLALATALNKVGNFKVKEACAWRGTPDVAIFKCDPVNIEPGRHVNTDLAGKIAEEFGKKRWDGITITLNGELGKAKLEVDIDIYANEYVPLRLGITNERLEVLARPVSPHLASGFLVTNLLPTPSGKCPHPQGVIAHCPRGWVLDHPLHSIPLWQVVQKVDFVRKFKPFTSENLISTISGTQGIRR